LLHRSLFVLVMLLACLWGGGPVLAAEPQPETVVVDADAGVSSASPDTQADSRAEGQADGAADGEADAKEPEKPSHYLTAKVVVTELEGDTETVSSFQFQRYGSKARVTGESREGDQFEADTFYDYAHHESYRNLTTDDLTFSYRMLIRERVKAQVYGLMPNPPYEPRYRMVINENIEFDGHPCTLTLAGFPTAGGLRALRWVWEAQDLDNQVVRVVFPDNYDRTIIIEFLDASNEPFDPALVALPEGTVVMSSF